MTVEGGALGLVGWSGTGGGSGTAKRRTWLVEGLLYQDGLTLVSAGKGWGKTTFVVDLLTAVASGAEFLGRRTTPGKVLHFAPEETRDEYEGRLERLGFAPCPEAFLYSTLASGDKESTMAAIEAEIERRQPTVVAFDPVGDFLRFGDLNDYGTKDAFMRLKGLRDRFPETHIIATHHNRKSPSTRLVPLDEAMNAVNGSVAVQSYFNAMFIGGGSVGKNSRHLYFWSRDGRHDRSQLLMDPSSGRLTTLPISVTRSPEPVALSDRAERVYDRLRSTGRSMTKTDIKTLLSLRTSAEVDAVIAELIAANRLEIDPDADNCRFQHYRAVEEVAA